MCVCVGVYGCVYIYVCVWVECESEHLLATNTPKRICANDVVETYNKWMKRMDMRRGVGWLVLGRIFRSQKQQVVLINAYVHVDDEMFCRGAK